MTSTSNAGTPYEPQLTPRFVAEGLHQDYLDRTPTPPPFSEVTTDSRQVRPGCLFVAISGEKFDGHDFIRKAIAAGAGGIICRKDFKLDPEESRGTHIFSVDDTLAAFRKLAAAWRREFAIPMIVVAGSAGKTTTKELLSAILTGRWPELLKTRGSQNGFLGIPITLLELRARHRAAVIEVGIDEVGAMREHIALVNPGASVLTTVGPEHMEKLIDIPTVAREEGIALTAVAQSGGFVAINLDDPWIRPHFPTLRQGKKLGYTLKTDAPLAASTLRGTLAPSGDRLRIEGPEGFALELPMPLLGSHNATNLLAAVAVAVGLGLSGDEIAAGLRNFKAAEGRSEVRKLANGGVVLCDYYNAQPPAVEAGLQLLTELAGRAASGSGASGGTRWACLGDMLELGEREEQYHRELAGSLVRLGVEHVLLYGERMRWLQDELKTREFPHLVQHFDSHQAMADALAGSLKPQDTLLIKGSRGMRMEEVWKDLERRVK